MDFNPFRKYCPSETLVFLLFAGCLAFYAPSSNAQSTSSTTLYGNKSPVNVALLVPMDRKYMFSYYYLIPALEIALEKINNDKKLLPRHYLEVRYSDTKCNEALSMNYAINYYMKGQVDVFFGPVCDYPLAPIVRQASFWNLPVISVLGNAYDFLRLRQTEYRMLTRVGPVNHFTITDFFLSQLRRYDWNRLTMIFDKGGQSITTDFCYFSAEMMMKQLKQKLDDLRVFNLQIYTDYDELLLDHIANNFAG